ncbi:hypothetical protein AYX13_05135 [Cryptococcus neoformans]|nr:hypothetical protein AYX13_05135 [Cryptococcus neoformans var. grubii]
MTDDSEAYNIDAFPNADFSARELPRPSFSRTQDVRGLVKHVRTVAWSCDGKKAATGGEYKEIQVWDESLDSKTTTPLPSASKPSPHNHHVSSIAWSPVDPNVLVSADKTFSVGSVIAVWDVTSPSAPVATFKTPGDVINLAWHPSGQHFAAVYPVKSRDLVDFFRLLTNESGEPKWEKREDITLGGLSHGIGSEEINSLRFINSGQLVCAVSNDGSVSAWIYPVESVRVDLADEQMEPEQEQGQEQEQEEQEQVEREQEEQEQEEQEQEEQEQEEKEPEVVTEGKEDGVTTEEKKDEMVTEEKEDKEGKGNNEEGQNKKDKESGEESQTKKDKQDAGDGPATPELPTTETLAEEPVGDVKSAEGNGDVEMTETDNAEAKANEESKEDEALETNKPESQDVEMVDAAQTHTQPSSVQPSRQPTPPPAKASPKPRAQPLKRYRHDICYAASLLSLAYDPRGRYFVVGGQDALLSLFDTKEWICERSFDVCSAAIRHTAFSYDGEFVAIGGDDLFIAIVSVYTGQTVAKIPIPAAVNALSWNPRKNSLAYCHQGKGGVPLWHIVHQE